MPLTAIITSTQERIVIFENPDRAKQFRDDLICPICEAPVVPVRAHFRRGHYVQFYARHKDTGHHDTAYRYHIESDAHLAAKKYLAENASRLLDLVVAQYQFEVRLPEIKRIADVMLTLDDSEQLAVEAQLSPITPEELEERTNDYARLGITVCWFLGKKARTDYNYRWCCEHTGFCGVLDIHEDVESLSSGDQRQAA